jgi:hypothetical protein
MKAIAIVPGLNLLYVTTATEHWTEEQPRADPEPGSATGCKRRRPASQLHGSVPTSSGGRPQSAKDAVRD